MLQTPDVQPISVTEDRRRPQKAEVTGELARLLPSPAPACLFYSPASRRVIFPPSLRHERAAPPCRQNIASTAGAMPGSRTQAPSGRQQA